MTRIVAIKRVGAMHLDPTSADPSSAARRAA